MVWALPGCVGDVAGGGCHVQFEHVDDGLHLLTLLDFFPVAEQLPAACHLVKLDGKFPLFDVAARHLQCGVLLPALAVQTQQGIGGYGFVYTVVLCLPFLAQLALRFRAGPEERTQWPKPSPESTHQAGSRRWRRRWDGST